MSARIRLPFSGVFSGTITRRPGETAEQVAARAELGVQNALDRKGRRFKVVVKVHVEDLRPRIRSRGRPRKGGPDPRNTPAGAATKP